MELVCKATAVLLFFDKEIKLESILCSYIRPLPPRKTKYQQNPANNLSLSPNLRNLPEQNASLENTYFQMHSILRLILERLAVWHFLPWLQYVPVSVFLPLIDQPGLPLTSGWIRAMDLKAHLMLLGLCMLLLQHYFDILCVHLLDNFKPSCNQRKPKCLLQAFCKDDVNLIKDEKLIYWIKMLEWHVYFTCLARHK